MRATPIQTLQPRAESKVQGPTRLQMQLRVSDVEFDQGSGFRGLGFRV